MKQNLGQPFCAAGSRVLAHRSAFPTNMAFRVGAMATPLAAGLLLLGCSGIPEGQTYPLPYDETYTKLYGMAVTREVCQQTYGLTDANARMDARTAEEISWIVSSRGKDWFRLTTRLAPAPEGQTGTVVAVDTRSIATDDGSLASAGADSLTVAQAKAVFAEKVDSTLTGRPFELRRVTAAVDRYLNPAAQPGGSQQSAAMQAGVKSAERDVLAFEQREKPQGNAPGEKAIC